MDDYNYFVELIKLHGRYIEFLEIFEIIIDNSEKNTSSSEIQKIVMTSLLQNDNN